jgi:hypothetical protein
MTETPSFVQASIINPKTGKISVYNPLLIDKDTDPLVKPVVPEIEEGSIVGLWFGSNGDTIVLDGDLEAGNCVNGLGADSPFGQFAYCNAPKFFKVANKKAKIPELRQASDGQLCPTARSFMLVDQDPSDNVQTTYLLHEGKVAQDTAKNRKLFPNAQVLVNPSDERLLSSFVSPALNCRIPMAPDLADEGNLVSSLALNELQALQQKNPMAMIPANDPMVLFNGKMSLSKLNLYRIGVNQKPITSLEEASPAVFCQNLVGIGASRIQKNKEALSAGASPDPEAANNLFNFMAKRFVATYDILDCGGLGFPNPVSLVEQEGIVTDSSFQITTEVTYGKRKEKKRKSKKGEKKRKSKKGQQAQ